MQAPKCSDCGDLIQLFQLIDSGEVERIKPEGSDEGCWIYKPKHEEFIMRVMKKVEQYAEKN